VANYQSLPILATEIPIEKDFTIGGQTYSWRFQYNETFDFYTVEIYDEDETLLYTTKLVYGGDIQNAVLENFRLANIVAPINLRDFQPIPLQNQKVNKESLGTTIQLLIGVLRE
jgi:hypothetical protein